MIRLPAKKSEVRISANLGEGQKSRVFRGLRKVSAQLPGHDVAIKVFKDQSEIHLFRQRFQDLVRVRSRYCVGVLGWELVDGQVAVLLDRVEGVSLEALLRNRTLSAKVQLEILAQVQNGLTELHSFGIFHGDLSPANIMVNLSGRVQLIDFGLIPSCAENEIVGTPAFLSPERWSVQGVTAGDDWFALGLLDHYMTENVPYWRQSHEQCQVLSQSLRGTNEDWLQGDTEHRQARQNLFESDLARQELVHIVQEVKSESSQSPQKTALILVAESDSQKFEKLSRRLLSALCILMFQMPLDFKSALWASGAPSERMGQAKIVVSSDAWLDVRINGKGHGFAPVEVGNLPAGRVLLELRGALGVTRFWKDLRSDKTTIVKWSGGAEFGQDRVF